MCYGVIRTQCRMNGWMDGLLVSSMEDLDHINARPAYKAICWPEQLEISKEKKLSSWSFKSSIVYKVQNSGSVSNYRTCDLRG